MTNNRIHPRNTQEVKLEVKNAWVTVNTVYALGAISLLGLTTNVYPGAAKAGLVTAFIGYFYTQGYLTW